MVQFLIVTVLSLYVVIGVISTVCVYWFRSEPGEPFGNPWEPWTRAYFKTFVLMFILWPCVLYSVCKKKDYGIAIS